MFGSDETSRQGRIHIPTDHIMIPEAFWHENMCTCVCAIMCIIFHVLCSEELSWFLNILSYLQFLICILDLFEEIQIFFCLWNKPCFLCVEVAYRWRIWILLSVTWCTHVSMCVCVAIVSKTIWYDQRVRSNLMSK